MKDEFKLVIENDGTVGGVYQDGLAEALDAEEVRVCRASNVEWEEIDGRAGWTVRAARDSEIALRTTDWCRWAPSREGTIVTFKTREEALAEEVKFFWDLLGKPTKTHCSQESPCFADTCPSCKGGPGGT